MTLKPDMFYIGKDMAKVPCFGACLWRAERRLRDIFSVAGVKHVTVRKHSYNVWLIYGYCTEPGFVPPRVGGLRPYYDDDGWTDLRIVRP